ncbi:MAG: endonuclease III [Deltaproteobacteria bacterium]|nr:endonuclease III [Deltaproteobacteria bacterium]
MGGRVRNSTPKPARAGGKPGASGRLATATPERAVALLALLEELYPDATVELDHQNAYQLLVATILAAQSTDKMINTITPALFARYPAPHALGAADPAELEPMIYKSGFFRMKARSLIGMARMVVEKHEGRIPETMAELVELPGVARKTANVVLGCALGKQEGIVVDTHVTRVAYRLGLTSETDPVKIEADLMAIVPRPAWTKFAHGLIWHGRRVCDAKLPDCDHCTLAPLCPSAGIAMLEAKARSAASTRQALVTKAQNKRTTTPRTPRTIPAKARGAKLK